MGVCMCVRVSVLFVSENFNSKVQWTQNAPQIRTHTHATQTARTLNKSNAHTHTYIYMHTNAYFFRFCIPIHTHSYPYFQLAPQLAAFPHNAFSSARIQARTHTNSNTLQVLLVTILLTSLLASKFSANSRICFLHLKQKKVYCAWNPNLSSVVT